MRLPTAASAGTQLSPNTTPANKTLTHHFILWVQESELSVFYDGILAFQMGLEVMSIHFGEYIYFYFLLYKVKSKLLLLFYFIPRFHFAGRERHIFTETVLGESDTEYVKKDQNKVGSPEFRQCNWNFDQWDLIMANWENLWILAYAKSRKVVKKL